MTQWTSPTAEAGASDNRNATTEFVTNAIGSSGTVVEIQSTVTITVSQTGTPINLVVASLTADTWECNALVLWDSGSIGSIQSLTTSISSTSATQNKTKSAYSINVFGAVSGPLTTTAGPVQVVLAVSGNLYVVVAASSVPTDTPACGYFRAKTV